jgi:hypothetical protein
MTLRRRLGMPLQAGEGYQAPRSGFRPLRQMTAHQELNDPRRQEST